MKSLREYITEAEQTFDTPQVGDDFAIICREECLLETYVCDHTEDGIVLHADDKMMRALEAYGYLKEEELSPLSLEEDEHEHDVEIQDTGEYDHEGDMAKDDLATIVRAARRLTGMLDDNENMPEWVQSKITKAADYVDTAADYIESNKQRDQEQGVAEGEDDLVDLGPALRNLTGEFNKFMKHDDRMKTDPAYAKKWNKRYAKYAGNKDHNTYDDPDDDKEQGMDEAKYQGREVPLGKPMKGDVKKSKVYVRGPKGNVVKVNFGQKGMKIKKNIPGRRKNFRARHNCDNPGPRWKARYWSCRAW